MKAKDTTYSPPTSDNVAVKPKPPPVKKPEVMYRMSAPIYNLQVTSNIYSQTMNMQITLMQHELLSLSPEVRSQVYEATSKCYTYFFISNGKLQFSLCYLQTQCTMALQCKSEGCHVQFTEACYLTWHQLHCIHYKLHQAASYKKKQEQLLWRLASKQPADNVNIEVSGFVRIVTKLTT